MTHTTKMIGHRSYGYTISCPRHLMRERFDAGTFCCFSSWDFVGLQCAWTATSVPFLQFASRCTINEEGFCVVLHAFQMLSFQPWDSHMVRLNSCKVADTGGFDGTAPVSLAHDTRWSSCASLRHPCTPENGAVAHGINLCADLRFTARAEPFNI